MNSEELFSKVIAVCPAFEALWDEHLADNHELLDHLLMADLGRFVAAFFTGQPEPIGGAPSESEVRAIMGVLDSALANGDESTVNCVAVSFVEYLWDEPYYGRLEPMLGPNLLAEVKKQREWRPLPDHPSDDPRVE